MGTTACPNGWRRVRGVAARFRPDPKGRVRGSGDGKVVRGFPRNAGPASTDSAIRRSSPHAGQMPRNSGQLDHINALLRGRPVPPLAKRRRSHRFVCRCCVSTLRAYQCIYSCAHRCIWVRRLAPYAGGVCEVCGAPHRTSRHAGRCPETRGIWKIPSRAATACARRRSKHPGSLTVLCFDCPRSSVYILTCS